MAQLDVGIKIGLFELSTRVGMPPVKDATLNQSLATVFDTLELTAGAFNHSDNPAEIVPELMTNAGMQVLMNVCVVGLRFGGPPNILKRLAGMPQPSDNRGRFLVWRMHASAIPHRWPRRPA